MVQARRLGYAVLSTPDIARQIEYFCETLGLSLCSDDGDRAVLSTACGVEFVVLVEGTASALRGMSFQLSPNVSLEAVAKEMRERWNIEVEGRHGVTPGVDEVLVVTDPLGIEIELFNETKWLGSEASEKLISPLKLGHIALTTPDVARASSFYQDVLGFRRSDWRENAAEFLRCGVDHHTINFFARPEMELQHLAFELRDFSEIARACDYLRRRNLSLDWGPARHNIGHNVACYHRNHDGVRVELYAEMDQMKDEDLGYFEPRPWHQGFPQKPRQWSADVGRNYWMPHER